MSKDINYNCVILNGDTSISMVESHYTFHDTKDDIEFSKEKSYIQYGNFEPEDDVITPEMLGQANGLYAGVRATLLAAITIPEGVTFKLVKARVEDVDLAEGEDIDSVEAYYVLEYEGMENDYSMELIDILSTEIKAGIQALFDAGITMTKAREGIT